MPAFEIPERSARDIISRRLMLSYHESGEAKAKALHEPLMGIVKRLIGIAETQVGQFESLQQNDKVLDPKDFREFVRSIGDLMDLQKSAAMRNPEKGKVKSGGEPESLAARLNAESEKDASPSSQPEPPASQPNGARTRSRARSTRPRI